MIVLEKKTPDKNTKYSIGLTPNDIKRLEASAKANGCDVRALVKMAIENAMASSL